MSDTDDPALARCQVKPRKLKLLLTVETTMSDRAAVAWVRENGIVTVWGIDGGLDFHSVSLPRKRKRGAK